jgi:hypothetical protein
MRTLTMPSGVGLVNSTTVRTKLARPDGPPRWIRAALGVARLGGTGAAAALAERLFLTPPRHAARAVGRRFSTTRRGSRCAPGAIGSRLAHRESSSVL